MNRTITYCVGDENNEKEFELEVTADEYYEAIYAVFANIYDTSVESARSIIQEFNLFEEMEDYQTEIKEYFEERAMEEWAYYEKEKKEGHPWSDSWFH